MRAPCNTLFVRCLEYLADSEEPHNIWARNLGQKLGLPRYHLGMQELLGPSDDEIYQDHWETIKRELAEFIEAIGRFTPAHAPLILNP